MNQIIDALIKKFYLSNDQNKEKEVYLFVSPSNNEWNKVAIVVAKEQDIHPNQSRKIICYPVIEPRKRGKEGLNISTNEWNKLLLNDEKT